MVRPELTLGGLREVKTLQELTDWNCNSTDCASLSPFLCAVCSWELNFTSSPHLTEPYVKNGSLQKNQQRNLTALDTRQSINRGIGETWISHGNFFFKRSTNGNVDASVLQAFLLALRFVYSWSPNHHDITVLSVKPQLILASEMSCGLFTVVN